MRLNDPRINPFRLFRRLGFRAQLVSLLLFVLGATLVTHSWVLYRNFVQLHEAEFDAALYNYAIDVAQSLNVNIFGEVFLSQDIRDSGQKIFPFALERTVLQLRTMRGEIVARSRELGQIEIPLDKEDREETLKRRASFVTTKLQIRNSKGTRYRIANLFIDQPGPADFILQVGSPMLLLEKERRGLLTFFLLSIPATLGIAAVLSIILSGSATRPINEIIRKARAITAKKIDERLPVPRVKDEIHELATTLNDLLGRLQDAFVSQESFVADASHQLKTPLAILRGELDLIRKQKRSPEELQAFLESASQEVGYLSRMVEQLLLIARLGSGKSGQVELHPTRIDEIIIDLVSRFQKYSVMSEKDLRLDLKFEGKESSDYTILGDFDLVRTLAESLIDNALKYTRPKTCVRIELRDLKQSIELSVRDEGEGFTPEEKERAFGRFWRAPKVETSGVKGSGLGLSIVRKIAELHDAEVLLNSTPGVGSEFLVRFRRAEA